MGLQETGTHLSAYLDGATLTADPVSEERKRTILVADDEAVVRTVLKSMLTRLGYNVLLADSAAEAINVYESHYAGIDMVFFDLFLNDMTGDMLYAQLRLIHPGTRAVLVTGNCESELIPEIMASGADGILGKPFDVLQLKETIANVLA
jgi:CheY-like chemotaxis protein